MQKFENVKPGDIVYIQESIGYGWNKEKCFFVPKKVDSISKTQFRIKDRKFRKDGRELGVQMSSAYFLGDKPYHYSDEVVTDQSAEMQNFKDKIDMEYNVKKMLDSIKIEYNSPFNIEELHTMHEFLTWVDKKANGNK